MKAGVMLHVLFGCMMFGQDTIMEHVQKKDGFTIPGQTLANFLVSGLTDSRKEASPHLGIYTLCSLSIFLIFLANQITWTFISSHGQNIGCFTWVLHKLCFCKKNKLNESDCNNIFHELSAM
jgi:hypothetical protein